MSVAVRLNVPRPDLMKPPVPEITPPSVAPKPLVSIVELLPVSAMGMSVVKAELTT
jgi:hypothetical protein